MQIKREGTPTFVPIVITLEADSELQAILRSVQVGYEDASPGSKEEEFLDRLRTALGNMW